MSTNRLIHCHAPLAQVCLCLLDLFYQFLMRFRYIVEGENAVAELSQEEGAEGDDHPERELFMKLGRI